METSLVLNKILVMSVAYEDNVRGGRARLDIQISGAIFSLISV